MNTSRNKVKARNRELNQTLQAQADAAKVLKEKRKVDGKISEILFGVGNLIFGGVVIGALFQETDYRLWIAILGLVSFLVMIFWGMYMFKNSIKE